MKTLLTISLLFIFACSSSETNTQEHWDLGVKFREENDLRQSITHFKKIIEKEPNSELAEKSQFQIADIYLNDVKDYPFAIDEFQKLLKQFPSGELAKKGHFMIAYIYSNYLDAYSDAISTYESFLTQYPNDELVPSVQFELEGLEKYKKQIEALKNKSGK